MTFNEFWKQSGWYNEKAELYEGTAEYSLAQDAYNAGKKEHEETLTKIKEWAKPEIHEPDQTTWAEGYDAARRWVRDVLIR